MNLLKSRKAEETAVDALVEWLRDNGGTIALRLQIGGISKDYERLADLLEEQR